MRESPGRSVAMYADAELGRCIRMVSYGSAAAAEKRCPEWTPGIHMGKQRLKHIQAGRLVREILWSAAYPSDSPKVRTAKLKCSSEARQKINDRCSWQKLKLLFAANFSYTDLVITLTYANRYLPKTKADGKKTLKLWIAQMREHRRCRGEDLRYIYCIENKHDEGRVHHHIVINGTSQDYDLIRSLWTWGTDIEIQPLDMWGYEDLAKYMTKEPREYGHPDVGFRSWVPSLNLRKPEAPPAEWVPDCVRLEAPSNAHVLHKEQKDNEWGRYAYIEYLLPEPPKGDKGRPSRAKKRANLFLSGSEPCILSGDKAPKGVRRIANSRDL